MSEIMGVLFAIFVGMMVIPKYGDYQTASNNNTRAVVTAQQQKQLNAAASAYIQQNSVTIQATATSTTPVIITVAMLQAPTVNLLPASFSATNPYGQTWQIEVLQPTAGNLQALSMATGGTALTDIQATKIATIVGSTGGFIPQNDSGIYPGAAANAYGAFAGWTISTANYTGITGGHPAALLTFNNGQLVSNYLYRNIVPGQPQLNTMNTPLIMASVQTVGFACSTGGIARDSTGAVLSCDVGTLLWKSAGGSLYWQDPVANVSTLPICNGVAAGQTRIVKIPTAGVGPRAYSCDGVSWQALGVDDNGNLTMTGTVTVGKVQLNDIVNENTTDANCNATVSTWGKLARDANGLILSCQSGIWKTPESSGQYSFFNSTTCPNGWIAADGTNGTVDVRGEFIRGWDNGRGVDPGRGLATWQADEIKSHTHTMTGTWVLMAAGSNYGTLIQSGTLTTNPSGGSESRPRNVALLACMKK